MKTGKLGKLFSSAMNFADDHQREIKLGLTIAGVVLTGISAAKAGMKASKIMEEQKAKVESLNEAYENGDVSQEEFDGEKGEITMETVKRMAPVVLPPVIIGGATIVSAVSGYSSASKQIAALTAAYNISEKTLTEYQEKAKEILGSKKEEAIKDAVTKDKIEKDPPKGKEIVYTGNGQYLCYDSYSGRYFRSNSESINKAVNEINRRLMDEYFISLNEFYYELGLADVKLGAELGFSMDDGLIDIRYTYTGEADSGEPVCVLNYNVSTKYHGRTF